MPLLQLRQISCLGEGLYLPVGQAWQSVAEEEPLLGLKVPAEQLVQYAWPGSGL